MDDTLLHALIPLYPLQVPVAGGDGGLDATFLFACLLILFFPAGTSARRRGCKYCMLHDDFCSSLACPNPFPHQVSEIVPAAESCHVITLY